MLHHIFQRLGITPDEVYAKPYKVRKFMFASMMAQLEAEDKERQEWEEAVRRGKQNRGG